MKKSKLVVLVTVAALWLSVGAAPAMGAGSGDDRSFQRIAHFPVFENSDQANVTVAEIIDVSKDGKTLIYSDALLGVIGFIDIADPDNPSPKGTLDVGGSPTSVAVAGRYALVGVDTTTDLDTPDGHVAVVDVASQTVVHTIPLGGQPDAVKISPDLKFAAIVIENQRDEEEVVNGVEGGLPQLPAGRLDILRLSGNPTTWALTNVALTGLSDYAPEDPEPEFVDIDSKNRAVVTLQENNHLVIVDLAKRKVVADFPAGEVTIEKIDTEDDGLLSFTGSITVPREPDAVSWLPGGRIVTANEGDLFGGSRGFTIFDSRGKVRYDSGNAFDMLAASHGHYPDARSDAKGSEPEGVDHARYGKTDYMFVGSERGSFVAVYRLDGSSAPKFSQLLPAGWGPEGLLPIPKRNLLVVTGEEDDAPNGTRAVVSIYRLDKGRAAYPDIVSVTRKDKTPIGWAALSGMVGDPSSKSKVYAVWDSFFAAQSRIFTIDVSKRPARITGYKTVTGGSGNYDPEGVAIAADKTFWIASEGNASDSRLNLLVQTDGSGAVLQEVGLPPEVIACRAETANRATLGSGFEGLAVGPDGLIYVAQQRGWNYTTPACEDLDDDGLGLNANGEPLLTRVWVYNPADGSWDWISYELEALSPLAAWVGLSEITTLPDGDFALIERDNLTGSFSQIKSLMKVDLIGDGDGTILTTEKTESDMLDELRAGNGWIHDKLEGLAITRDGATFAVTDNDGVDDSSGETQFLRLGRWNRLFNG